MAEDTNQEEDPVEDEGAGEGAGEGEILTKKRVEKLTKSKKLILTLFLTSLYP